MKFKPALGFTLVELLVVIAILAILAIAAFVLINPLESRRKGQDSVRLSDLANLNNAINVAVQESTQSGSQILCTGSSYPCTGDSFTGTRSNNGTGWVRVNLGSAQVVTVPTLPRDPVNTSALHYTYCADNPGNVDAWEIAATLESNTYQNLMTNDGGNDTARYEIGSNLTLIAASGGSCTY